MDVSNFCKVKFWFQSGGMFGGEKDELENQFLVSTSNNYNNNNNIQESDAYVLSSEKRFSINNSNWKGDRFGEVEYFNNNSDLSSSTSSTPKFYSIDE